MDRKAFLDLFPTIALSTSLKELTPYLPVYGIAEISGIDVLSIHKFPSLEEAEKQIANYNALAELDNGEDFDDQPQNDQVSDNTNSVRKQLTFDTPEHTPSKSSKATPAQHTPTNSEDKNQVDFETAIKAVDDTDPSDNSNPTSDAE